MKYLLLIPVALLFCFAAKAQKTDIYKNKPWEDWKKKKLLSEELNKQLPQNDNLPVEPLQPQKEDAGVMKLDTKGKFSGMNNKGDRIYAMTPDNMPCLVPGESFKSNMPVAGVEKNSKTYYLPQNKEGRFLPQQNLEPVPENK